MSKTQLSKRLSFILRHKPESVGLSLDKQGWANVADLLSKTGMTRPQLDDVVSTNDKKRFELSDDDTRIRASQGHSVNVELGYEPQGPPEYLYHGTADRTVPTIMEEGLKPMNRHHVHLSPDMDTAKSVGSRYGKPVVLRVDSGQMHRDGKVFYRSTNGVWLVDSVSPSYLEDD